MARTEHEMDFLSKYTELAYQGNRFDPELYQRFNVKRGLRNADGSGVLIGLTQIGNVHGYIMDENEVVPVEGQLRYRGIDIKAIVEGFTRDNRFGFEETIFLLLMGYLPTAESLDEFNAFLSEKRELPAGFWENMILKAPSPNIMNKLSRCILVSYSYDDDPESTTLENNLRQSIELIARFPVFIAYGYQAKRHYYDKKSLFIHNPQPGLSTAELFLSLIRQDKQYTQAEAELLDLCMVLHAEHGGGNNSSFTTHVVSSADTDAYSAYSAAIGSLKGRKHGGANIKVSEMMNDLMEHVSNWENEDEVVSYLEKILKKEAGDKSGLIYGLGHAIYTLSDPRALLLRKRAKDLAMEKDRMEEFELYTKVERLAPLVYSDFKKSGKIISANVDFYSGLVYSMLGIPHDLYTPIFAMARIAGWAAHRLEEVVSGGRIMRPAFKNVTEKKVYTPLAKR